jgi:K+-transporting ATPase ATPase A chain
MVCLFVVGLVTVHVAEQQPTARNATVAGANMEGKEARFGIGGSTLAAVVTSNGATGSYNSMHDSYTPLGGMILLVNMLLGEVVFGGLGTGLSSIVMGALIAVFLARLMIGRTPEYVAKRIGPTENKLIVLYTVVAPLAILSLTAVALITQTGLAGLTTNSGPHGLTEIMFAYTSSFANNGQSFAGLSANSPFYNLTTAVAMMAGCFGLAIPALALAGVMARQGRAPVTIGILRTDSLTFGHCWLRRCSS